MFKIFQDEKPTGRYETKKFASHGLQVNLSTVEPVITHTPRWMAQAMGYYRSWLSRGGLKIDLKAIAKFLG